MPTEQPDESSAEPGLRIAFVPGVTIRKWTTRWAERHPDAPFEVLPTTEADGVAVLRSGVTTVSFVRLPVDRDGLSVIRLYGEVPVLVVPRDSELAPRDSVTVAEVEALEGVVPYEQVTNAKDAVALVAAGVGAVRLPHSLARLNARKDVAAIPIEGAAETEIALCWVTDETTQTIEEFVGIVRGRTAASSRSVPTPPKERPKRATASPARGPRRPQKRARRQGR